MMKKNAMEKLVLLAFGVVAAVSARANTITVTGPVTASQMTSLNNGASYGMPSAAVFTDGPLTVNSGTSTPLLAGPTPGQSDVDYLLFVVSGSAANVATLGSVTITINGQLPTYSGGGSVTFHASDFFTTTAAGFPGNITSIANGTVNGISFPNSVHAGAEATGFDFGSISSGTILANVSVSSPIDLRVDIFGVDAAGAIAWDTIANNAANSGALGVSGGSSVPDGASTLALLGFSVVGIDFLRRKTRRG